MTNSQQEPSSQSIKMISIVMKYPGILVQLLYQTPILVILPRRNMTDDLLDSEWSQVIWTLRTARLYETLWSLSESSDGVLFLHQHLSLIFLGKEPQIKQIRC